jgi:hypothetical protein
MFLSIIYKISKLDIYKCPKKCPKKCPRFLLKKNKNNKKIIKIYWK